MLISIFGIDGGIVSLVINMLVLFLVVTYLALIYWTYLDAKRRIEDPVLIACATAASVFPFIGTIVYTILRPPEFLEDRDERELELRAAELRLRQLIEQSCPHCEFPIEASYQRCPNCERKLRSPCRKCNKPLDPKWGVCPYCETEVRRQRSDRSSGREGGRRAERSARQGGGQRPNRGPGGGGPPSKGSSNRPDGSRRDTQRPAVGSQGSQSSQGSQRSQGSQESKGSQRSQGSEGNRPPERERPTGGGFPRQGR